MMRRVGAASPIRWLLRSDVFSLGKKRSEDRSVDEMSRLNLV
jgi:hypothetical protein